MGDPVAAAEPRPEDFERMLELADLATPSAIRVATTLGIVDRLGGAPATIDELADHAGADRRSVRSLLGVLAARGLMSVTGDGTVELTTTGRTLLHPHARRAFDLTSAEAHIDATWSDLLHVVTTGTPGYERVHGRPFWDHLAADSRLSASFDGYLADHAIWAGEVAGLPVWPATGTVVDVGGGDGAALATILGAHPGLRGTLVEVDAVAARAERRLADAGLAERARVVAGSFFDPLPPDGDVYLLAHVLHDWPDDDAAAILARVAETSAARVLLVEQVIDARAPTFAHAYSDLRMRMLFGAGERTSDEWGALASRSGFAVAAVHRWTYGAVIELAR